MADEMVRVYIEDYGLLGVAAYPEKVRTRPVDPMLNAGICEVPREQAERWSVAEAAWEAAQAEMRPILKARLQQRLDALAEFAGYRSAQRAETKGRRR